MLWKHAMIGEALVLWRRAMIGGGPGVVEAPNDRGGPSVVEASHDRGGPGVAEASHVYDRDITNPKPRPIRHNQPLVSISPFVSNIVCFNHSVE